jgi:1-acyl-sn-glycerol-3-phosphate acyltransferase
VIRGWWKALVLVISLSQCVVTFFLLRLRKNPTPLERALWLHESCKFVLRRTGFGLRVIGQPPARGLLVSNHLSYLDIMLFGSVVPCVFVSKSEVRRWPILGLLAALGGTVFIDRSSKVSAAQAAQRIEKLLADGILVLIFPEGTSSDGTEVLRFHTSLFEPAIRAAVPVTAASIGYTAIPNVSESSLCYYGDVSFGPHILKTMQLETVTGTIRFAPSGHSHPTRKHAAIETQRDVLALRQRSAERIDHLPDRSEEHT